MTRKEEIAEELEKVLEEPTDEGTETINGYAVLRHMYNFFSADELEQFLEHVKTENGL